MAGNPHPVFQDGVPVEKANARAYLPLRLGNPDALRALDGSTFWLCYIQTLVAFFYRDTSDTTSEDNGTSVIVDGNGGVWKFISSGAGIAINAAGPVADRGDFDTEAEGFTYFGTDTGLLYVRLTAGGWSDGSTITGPQGEPGADGADGRNFEPDEVVPDLAGRAAYDASAKNFAVLVESDTSNSDLPTLYFKMSATSGDWSGGFTFEGGGGIQSIVEGNNIDIDDTDPQNPIISVSGGDEFANLIVNPGMEIDQANEGLVLTVPTNGANIFGPDRWNCQQVITNGDPGVVLQQISDAPPGYCRSLNLSVSSGVSVNNTDDQGCILFQNFAPEEVTSLAYGTAGAKTTYARFWVKTSHPGVYGFSLQGYSGAHSIGRSWCTTFTVDAADTWEEKIIGPIPGDTASTSNTWLSGPRGSSWGIWGQLAICLEYPNASTFATYGTDRTWEDGNSLTTTDQTGQITSFTDGYFRLTGVEWFISDGEARAARRGYAEELRRCRWTYRKSMPQGVAPGVVTKATTASTATDTSLTTNAATTIGTGDKTLHFASTSGVSVGDGVFVSGIPVGTTVLSVTSTTVTLSDTPTATIASGASVAFRHPLKFGTVGGIGIGANVSGTNIPAVATVVAKGSNDTDIIISAALTGSVSSGATVAFIPSGEGVVTFTQQTATSFSPFIVVDHGEPMRAAAGIKLYSKSTGAEDTIYNGTSGTDIDATIGVSSDRSFVATTNSAAASSVGGFLQFHWTARVVL